MRFLAVSYLKKVAQYLQLFYSVYYLYHYIIKLFETLQR